jgi:hypothetical protein
LVVTVFTLGYAHRDARSEREQHRRCKAGERGEHFTGDRLLGLLQVVHLRADRREALGRVVETNRELRDHRRDPVVVRAAFAGRPHRHGHQGPHDAAVHALAAAEQQITEPTGEDGQHDVVDGAAEPASHGLHVGERRACPVPAAVRTDRAVE